MPWVAALLLGALQAAPASPAGRAAALVRGAMQSAQAPAQPASPPPAAPPAAAAPAQAAPAQPALPPNEAYTYQPDGRRDPFLSLLGTGAQTAVAGKRGEGAAGLTVSEIVVRGIVESRGKLIAMVSGPDNKTYIVHPGDKLVDGTIRTITNQGIVITQEVTDPLSLVKQRDVRKLLRSVEQSSKE
jgi:type IV pilus assembly protein PilP